ncbi:hypothetical protein [Aerosakkonema funiforme]|uniref:hypothetical protein n=1 Tax=Aerosakkonema funiforme TaxID=1246630 RepID=UPI0035B733C1
MGYALDPESIRAYRNRVMVYSQDLWREKDPQIRATLAMYLADAATTLARLEVEEARKLQEEKLAQNA